MGERPLPKEMEHYTYQPRRRVCSRPREISSGDRVKENCRRHEKGKKMVKLSEEKARSQITYCLSIRQTMNLQFYSNENKKLRRSNQENNWMW